MDPDALENEENLFAMRKTDAEAFLTKAEQI